MALDRRSVIDRRGPPRGREAEALAGALDRNEIEVLFQPQFAVIEGRLAGAEALARWHHPELGLVGAEELFAMAGAADLGEALAHRIARSALAVAADWPAHLHLSLNVTAADLAAGHFADTIAGHIAATGFAPGRLTLEITEGSLVTDVARSAERLRPLVAQGVRIALDDFGAGFCNFAYLKHLPLHGLKLDRSMLEGVDTDPRDLAVLRGILAMARALGLEVTAEGVERERQLETVIREGCALWQGYLGGMPMSAAGFAELFGR